MKYFFSFCNSCGISGVCMFFPESDVRQDKRKILCASCFEEAQNLADVTAAIDELKMEPFYILRDFKRLIRDLKKKFFGKPLKIEPSQNPIILTKEQEKKILKAVKIKNLDKRIDELLKISEELQNENVA